MIRLLTVLSAVISAVISTIRPGLFPNATMMQKDTLVFYMNKLFDVSQANGIPTFTSNIGTVRNYMTPLATRALTGSYNRVEVVEFIDNTTFAVVLDNSHTIIQSVDLEGNRFTTNVDFTYFQFGANIRCDDVEVYYPTEKAYVLCWDIETEPTEEPGSIYLIEFDLGNTANKRVIKVDQTDGYSANHRLRMGIWNLPQGGQNEVYIIVYDQGISSTDVRNNKWFRVFDRIRLGAANYAGVVNIGKTFKGARSLYDIFYFKNQLLMTTSMLGQYELSMTSCTFFISNLSVSCNEEGRKNSNITLGYIGMTNNNRWIQFSLNTNEFITCDVGPTFSSSSWIGKCDSFNTLPKFEDCFIRIVEDNWHAKVAVWVHPNGEYAGISVHSKELNRSWKEDNVTAVLINKYLYTATNKDFNIRRLEYDNLIVTARDLAQEENTITVSAKDADTSAVTVNSLFKLMDEPTDMIHFDDDHTLPEVDVYGGYTFYMPLVENDFMGNNLSFTPKFDESIKNYTKSKVYSTFPVNVIYTFKETGLPEFNEITFTKNYAIGQDVLNRIFFFKCGSTEFDIFRCDEQFSINSSPDMKLLKYSSEVQGYILVAVRESSKTTVMLFDPNSNAIYTNSFVGMAADIHSLVIKGRTWIFASYPDTSIVMVSSWSPVNPSFFHNEPAITLEKSNMPYFCPIDVYDTYNGSSGYLEVLSICYHTTKRDQRIFRFELSAFNMVGSHPISLDINHPEICAVGNVYIIASINQGTIIGKSQTYDETTFNFYLDQYLDYNNILGMNCVPKSNMVTVYFEDKYHRLGYFNLWADSMFTANKRVHSTVTGAEAGSVNLESFTFGDSVMHVLYDAKGSFNYYRTFNRAPVVKIEVEHISETAKIATGVMMLNLRNGGDSGASIQNKLTIRRLDTSISVKKSGKTAEMSKKFDLEDYISIKGHVFNASLRDSRNSRLLATSFSATVQDNKVSLIQRANMVSSYIPSEVEQVIYQHIEAHDNYTIALHIDKSFASFFTIFTNSVEHAGVIQPRDSVHAFDFATASGNRALIVYSNAIVSGNKLRLMLISDASKIFEGSIDGKSYEKIRIARVDDKDNFLIMALDIESQTVDFFTCGVSTLSFSVTFVRTLRGIMDFDFTLPGKYINFFYLTDEGTILNYYTWDKKKATEEPQADGKIEFQDEHSYWLRSVSCATDDETQSSCVLNTLGTVIYEVVLKNGQEIAEKVYMTEKFGDYDGQYLYIDTQFIAMRAVSSTLPRKYAFLIWKRMGKGGDNKTYCGVEISGESPAGTDIYSHFTPYTMNADANGDHMLFAGTHNEKEPLQFYKVDRFKIDNSASNNDLSKIYLDVGGFGGSVAEVGTLNQFSSEEDKNLKWWVPTLIVIALLICAAVTYFICVHKSKAEEGENESQGYRLTNDPQSEHNLVKADKNDDDA